MIHYFVILTIAIIYAIIRAEHDQYIKEGEWKKWAMVEAAFLTLVITGLIAWNTEWLLWIPMFFIFGLTFWLAFDIDVGYKFGGKLFYLGSGKWDTEVKKIFIAGWFYAFCKLVGIVGFSGLYFAMIK